jgi:hypothetical protein
MFIVWMLVAPKNQKVENAIDDFKSPAHAAVQSGAHNHPFPKLKQKCTFRIFTSSRLYVTMKLC